MERSEWLMAAMETIGHERIPAAAFIEGARKCRAIADHPAKVVPTIIRESADHARYLREQEAIARRRLENATAPRLVKAAPEYITVDEAEAILKEMGIALDGFGASRAD